MTGVLGFFCRMLVAAFKRLRRVLAGQRGEWWSWAPTLRRCAGTPAAPEADRHSRLHFYNDQELRQLAIDAGLCRGRRVVRRNLIRICAQKRGVPEEHLPLFKQPRAFSVLANK